ncbi:head-to-tail adaptor [Gordonia phage Pleakley]|uniref:Head-to-tail adaptor n=1 Tax=Gordonia phage Pleakley TaxID=2283246 RepID=A0A345M6F8_9CAUD|nr:head-to-tail adaptor [Gordonia phage Pleakley]AXH49766.1 head-to-tail adaptor [Gordonia phage Fury]AXH66079.1 head-to-tail adaptor [Gordonia phage Pleakley]
MAALATFDHVQRGFEKPIPNTLKPKVEEFLARASRRLHMIVGAQLQTALDKAIIESNYDPEQPEDDDNVVPHVVGFARDMVVQAAENKLRNFGGYTSESAGVFSVTRDDYWGRGRVTFEPEDLALLQQAIDDTFGETIRGPIRSPIPAHRWP